MAISQQAIMEQLDKVKKRGGQPTGPAPYTQFMPSIIPNMPPELRSEGFKNQLASIAGLSDAATQESFVRRQNQRDYEAVLEAEKRLAKAKKQLKKTERPEVNVPVGQPNFITNPIPVQTRPQGNKKGSNKSSPTTTSNKPAKFQNTSGPGWKDPTPINRSTVSTRNVTTFNWQGKPVTVHPAMVDNFRGLLNELAARGYKVHTLGSHAVRGNTSDPSVLSMHAYGLAIDINPAQNPYGQSLVTNMPPGIARLASKYGLQWGGAWNTVKDAMHFSLKGGFGGSAG